jgi:DNA helicase IV
MLAGPVCYTVRHPRLTLLSWRLLVAVAGDNTRAAEATEPTINPTPPVQRSGDRPGDEEIAAERAYLATARAALRRMHADVVDTDTPEFDSEDNDEIWHNTVYRQARERRAAALMDLPDVPLFFGRLDYEPGTVFDPGEASPAGTDRIYIGRRHVHDADGRPVVVDWRAPVSTPFYRASRDDPQEVRLRRRYGFDDAAELTAYEDEPLVGVTAARPPGDRTLSDLVTAEIERPRAGPMRDIVATIQPDQDHLVRAPLHPSLCVQGAPGTGKTAVGLHRLAYLLYAERDRLDRVAVVGPNRSFLSYIRRVLPALGEVNVTQTTIEQLIGRGEGPEEPEVARIKGDARMSSVLHRALWLHLSGPAEGLLYVRGATRYRVSPQKISETVAGLRASTRYGPGRDSLAQRLAHLVLFQMERRGAAPDDRDQAAVARSKPVKQVVDQVWPKVNAEQVLHRLLSDADFLAAAAGEQLSAGEQALLCWGKRARSWRSARWSVADAALLDELDHLIERTPSWSHIVVDEAQDLSPMQCRAIARRSTSGSLTVLGDLAQGTSPWAVEDWPALLAHLGKTDAELTTLTEGFRVPAQIIDYAARLLPRIAPHLGAPRSVRRAAGALRVTPVAEADLLGAVARACRQHLTGPGSIGVITADTDVALAHRHLRDDGLDAALLGETANMLENSRLVCVTASLAKGLEFDTVVVVEPARIVAAEPRGLNRLYVVLTRAVSNLDVIHAAALPPELT